MTTTNASITLDPTTIGATLAPIEAAAARAASDEKFAELLKTAKAAGSVYGAAQGKSEATTFYKALADKIAPAALVALGQVSDELRAMAPTSDHFPADVATASVMLVELFGLVQESIGEAQKAAAATMRRLGKGTKSKEAAASARKSITQGINRSLAYSDVKADFFACKVELIEPADEVTDAEKAAKQAASAFALHFVGALDAFDNMDASQLAMIASKVSALQAAAAVEAERAKCLDLVKSADSHATMADDAAKRAAVWASTIGTTDALCLADRARACAEDAEQAAKQAACAVSADAAAAAAELAKTEAVSAGQAAAELASLMAKRA